MIIKYILGDNQNDIKSSSVHDQSEGVSPNPLQYPSEHLFSFMVIPSFLHLHYLSIDYFIAHKKVVL